MDRLSSLKKLDVTAKGIQIEHEKGREEGERQAKIAVARNLLKSGVSIDLKAESTGLPQAELTHIKEEISMIFVDACSLLDHLNRF